MIARPIQSRGRSGSILVATVIIVSLVSFSCIGMLGLSRYHHQKQYTRVARAQAYYTAENVMLEGIQKIIENASPNGSYTGSSIALPYTPDSSVTNMTLTIEDDPAGVGNNYLVTGTATVNGKKRTVQSLVCKDPPSKVFDYEYFLNNWGWWWGNTITGNGAQRSNWDFDFRSNPTVNGDIYANGQVESNMTAINPFGTMPFRGLAGNNPISYVHAGAPRVTMPNLQNITNYEAHATGTIKKNGTTVVSGVQGDTESKDGIYLEGTSSQPLVINGTVVIEGDLIIKGVITGTGTIYVGGNTYLAGNVTYANGPSFSTAPETMSSTARDQWVDNAISQNKDLVAIATSGCVLGGRVNNSSWKSSCYDASTYGLKNVGGEASLGADGIAGTADDGVAYLDTNGDGTADSAWYDADGDGTVDSSYNYDTNLKMTSTRIANIQDYPTSKKTPVDYNTVASDTVNRLDGIYYTNHAFASYTHCRPDHVQRHDGLSRRGMDLSDRFDVQLRFTCSQPVSSEVLCGRSQPDRRSGITCYRAGPHLEAL